MTIADLSTPAAASSVASRGLSAGSAQALLAVAIAAAAVGGLMATDAVTAERAAGIAGSDLTRLLRAMAAIKAMLAVGVAAAVFWRLSTPVSAARLAVYALGCAAMAAGPPLIWNMAEVAKGALLLHGGLAMTLVLLWRDPAVGRGLAAAVARRRSRLRQLNRA